MGVNISIYSHDNKLLIKNTLVNAFKNSFVNQIPISSFSTCTFVNAPE